MALFFWMRVTKKSEKLSEILIIGDKVEVDLAKKQERGA